MIEPNSFEATLAAYLGRDFNKIELTVRLLRFVTKERVENQIASLPTGIREFFLSQVRELCAAPPPLGTLSGDPFPNDGLEVMRDWLSGSRS